MIIQCIDKFKPNVYSWIPGTMIDYRIFDHYIDGVDTGVLLEDFIEKSDDVVDTDDFYE